MSNLTPSFAEQTRALVAQFRQRAAAISAPLPTLQSMVAKLLKTTLEAQPIVIGEMTYTVELFRISIKHLMFPLFLHVGGGGGALIFICAISITRIDKYLDVLGSIKMEVQRLSPQMQSSVVPLVGRFGRFVDDLNDQKCRTQGDVLRRNLLQTLHVAPRSRAVIVKKVEAETSVTPSWYVAILPSQMDILPLQACRKPVSEVPMNFLVPGHSCVRWEMIVEDGFSSSGKDPTPLVPFAAAFQRHWQDVNAMVFFHQSNLPQLSYIAGTLTGNPSICVFDGLAKFGLCPIVSSSHGL
ncbi:uncharacterized protein LAESUDRAFT_712507 [Laetiporus sulphureus 93-53]|uniref:Transmembrane protein n=1 Tax=Laetiporus sulphureus 93-53 TaxID=1314785 RepID=A0A165FFE7_9APHY|nr:uncharacterized protein LAESUDRAFT_712507 [Laetiporus sulphureus 93-53]KZT08887.1 hypothetical protein LAESUDRAFT_712507 [Laetiporus sulphureus 93-53]